MQSQAAAMTDDYLPNLGEILNTLWRRRMQIAAIMAATILLGTLLVLLKPKEYKATATIMVTNQATANNPASFQDVTAGAAFDDTTVQTEVNVLESPVLALATIKATHLNETEEFANKSGHDDAAISKFLSHLTVAPQGGSRIIGITFAAKDPALAARVANALVDVYMNYQVDFKKQRVVQLSHLFETQVATLQTDVAKKSQSVQDYRAKESLTVGKDAQDVVYQQITDISAQLAPLQVHKFDVESRLQAIQAVAGSGQPDAIEDVVKSPLIQNLKAQASTIAQTVASLRGQYGPNHPKYIAARQELDQVNRAIANETANIMTSLKNDDAATVAQETMLTQRLDELRKQSVGLGGKLITLNGLQADVDASQKVLDSFLATAKNIQSQVDFGRPDAVIISRADVPLYPAKPSKKLLMLAVLVFSALLAPGIILLLEVMRGGLGNFDDIRRLGRKPLGILPLSDLPDYQVIGAENSSYKEAVKRIYMSGLMNTPARTIMVTSALPKEGRTTFVLSMAHYLASIGHKVAVVDADFHHAALSFQTRKPSGPGLTDVLSGRAALADAADTGSDGLTIIRAGTPSLLSPDLLKPAPLRDLFAQLHQSYAYVLIDSEPLLAHSEAGAIANQTDGIIVVTEWIKTSKKNIANMFHALDHLTAPVLGIVINKVNIDKYKTFTAGSDFLLPKIANG